VKLELVDLLSIINRPIASVSCVIIKHNDTVLSIDVLRNQVEEIPKISDVGLVTDHILHLRELQTDSSNDSS